MPDPPTKEHVPTPEDLDREARRLARVRRLSLVPEPPARPGIDSRFVLVPDLDPDPKEAA
jgi:hypothetical protein